MALVAMYLVVKLIRMGDRINWHDYIMNNFTSKYRKQRGTY